MSHTAKAIHNSEENSCAVSISRDLIVLCRQGAGIPQTVADMVDAFRYTVSLPHMQCLPKHRNFLSEMGMVARRCAAAIGKEPEVASLESLVLCDEKLVAHLRADEQDRSYIIRHCSYKNKMLALAHSKGWTCDLYERKLQCLGSWEPIRAAMYGDTEGCLTIVTDAERQLLDPSDLDEEFLAGWRTSRSGRSQETVEGEEGRFRSKMRQASLESLFPKLNLSSRLPDRLSVANESLPDVLTQHIDGAVKYKTDLIVKGRPGKKRVKPSTANGIRTILRNLCGIAISVLPIAPTSLAEVLILDVICAFIAELRERGVQGSGIRSRLGLVRFIFETNLVPKGDYRWFGRELRKLRNEPRWRLDERQRARCVAYEELAKVPERIHAYRIGTKGLSQIAIAWLSHDRLFSSLPLYLPWRFCSIAACGLFAPAFINIIDHELTDAMRADPDLPEWAQKALDHDPHQRFLQFSFGKSQCKNNHSVRELFPLELVDLYSDYITHYRKLIVDEAHDDGTLFLNRRGRQMSSQVCRDLYQRLVQRWIGRHARPHLTRDSYCEYHLVRGGSMRQLKRMLWHRDLISTERYCRRYDTSHGAVALNADLERRRNRKAA